MLVDVRLVAGSLLRLVRVNQRPLRLVGGAHALRKELGAHSSIAAAPVNCFCCSRTSFT
jgi:hypothetical protein